MRAAESTGNHVSRTKQKCDWAMKLAVPIMEAWYLDVGRRDRSELWDRDVKKIANHIRRSKEIKALLKAAKAALALFENGHAIDNFNWAHSTLSAENIQELNETPLKLKAAIAEVE